MSFTLNSECKNIQFCDELITSLFEENALKSLKVTSVKNCCTTSVAQEYDFIFPDEECVYSSNFCINDVFTDPTICIPEGLTCEAKDYYYIKHLYFLTNGVSENILPAGTNLDYRVAANITTLEGLIQTYLDSKEYNRATFTVTTDVDECITITFSNLPNGVVPEVMLIHNTEVCYVKLEFECLDNTNTDPCKGDVDNTCDKWVFEMDVSTCYVAPIPPSPPTSWVINNITWQDADCDLVNINLCVFNQAGSLVPGIPVGDCPAGYDPGFQFTYCENNVSTIDFAPLVTAIQDQLTTLGSSADITIGIDANHLLTIEFENLTNGVLPVTLNSLDTVFRPLVTNAKCSSYTQIDPACIWTSTIATDEESNLFSATSTILLFDSVSLAPKSILTGSWTVDQLVELKAAVDAYMASESISGTFTVTHVDNVLTYTFTDLPVEYTPHEVIYVNTNSATKSSLFLCSEIDHIPDDQYLPANIEWTTDCLIIKPPFLGGDTSINDGIYNIEIKITDIEDKIHTFKKCFFVDCCVRCAILEIENIAEMKEAYELYEAAKLTEDCGDCECEEACKLYARLLKVLKQNTNKDLTYGLSCGC